MSAAASSSRDLLRRPFRGERHDATDHRARPDGHRDRAVHELVAGADGTLQLRLGDGLDGRRVHREYLARRGHAEIERRHLLADERRRVHVWHRVAERSGRRNRACPRVPWRGPRARSRTSRRDPCAAARPPRPRPSAWTFGNSVCVPPLVADGFVTLITVERSRSAFPERSWLSWTARRASFFPGPPSRLSRASGANHRCARRSHRKWRSRNSPWWAAWRLHPLP